MKLISFYLPQFHETEDNNKWWGKGYTDWDAARNAKPMFKGHNQPRVPLNDNYYDLSDESAETIKWQAKLAKDHGIFGFCIYHYWFAGKKELEKPAEILLAHPEIDIHYTFSWDSGSWKRTWYSSEKEQEILIQQDYGDESVWERHFYDLLPFFMDERYIKIDNRPVFHIYVTRIIPCLEGMKNCWDRLARKHGFDGIYLISGDGFYREKENPAIDAYYNYEPVHCFDEYSRSFTVKSTVVWTGIKKRINRLFGTRVFQDKRSAKAIYRVIKKDKSMCSKPVYLGTFVDYDDTPRRQERGAVYVGNTPELFEASLRDQIKKSIERRNDFLYINAWNEWGEGAYLEPDSKKKCTYLEKIRKVMSEYE